jgi:exopolysaccharide production protein ExoZ
LNRILRIVPLYWLATIVLVAVFSAGFQPNGLHYLTPAMVVRSLLFIKSEFPDGRTDLILSLGWTLIFELYFYAVFAATLILKSLRRSLALVTFVFATSIAVRAAFGPFPAVVDGYGSTITLEFAFGGLIALLYLEWTPEPSRWHPIVASVLILAGISMAVLATKLTDVNQGNGGLRFIYFGVPAFSIVAGALIFERTGRRIRNELVLLLGAASYSLYLFHPMLLQGTVKVARRLLPPAASISPYLAGTAALAVTLATTVLIHLYIEQRIMQFGKRHADRRDDKWPLHPEVESGTQPNHQRTTI